jgi:serine/threonine-protein kinase
MICGLNVTLEYQAAAIPAEASGSDTQARLQAALAGRYDVVRELGHGGMATVFLARDLKHEREVAIKLLHPDLAASLGGERFEREIKLAAKLQHPHILALYDSGVAGELLYYVMPFVKGESLRDRLVRESMLPVDDAVRIALEVCSALGYAHAEGIVHRDIKPENILLAGGHALVADFGIARAIGELGSGGHKLTQTGMSVGTPVYMAPEQASGEAAGPTADIYSLGCVLYEMLAGEPPFTGPNPMAIMARHLMEQVPSVRIVRSAVPEEIEAAIFAALGKLPVDRPQTAAQFAEIMGMPLGSTATMRAMRGTATRRVPSGAQAAIAPPAPAHPAWRRPAVIGGVVAVVALLVAGGVWATSKGPRGTVSDDPLARRIAVLYLDDRSSDNSLRPVADGLTEGLIHSLGNATSLTVISRAGVDRYRGSALPIDSIARALRAGYVVRGDVERDGSNVRVNLRLDDRSGANLKRATIAVPAGNTLRIRDTLALMASALLRQEIGAEIEVREQRSDTRNEAAWLLVQRGLTAERNAVSAVGRADSATAQREFRAADSLFEAAEKADGAWSVPITQRAALAYRRSRSVGSDAALIRTWVTTGLAHADRAIAIDANSADAFQTRGELRYWGWLNTLETDAARRAASLAAAKADLERSTTIDSKQAGAFATLSHLLNNDPGSTINDVYIAAQRALDADEFLSNANVVLYRLFLAAYDLGQTDKADQFCASFRQRFPGDPRSMRCQLYTFTQPRETPPDIAVAWKLADSLAAVEPPPTRERERLTGRMLVAAAIARASKTTPSLADSARRVARQSEGSAAVDGTREAAFRGAFVYALLGDKADAVRLLTAYFAANPNRVSSFAADPGWWFRDLQGDPQFQRLVGATR